MPACVLTVKSYMNNKRVRCARPRLSRLSCAGYLLTHGRDRIGGGRRSRPSHHQPRSSKPGPLVGLQQRPSSASVECCLKPFSPARIRPARVCHSEIAAGLATQQTPRRHQSTADCNGSCFAVEFEFSGRTDKRVCIASRESGVILFGSTSARLVMTIPRTRRTGFHAGEIEIHQAAASIASLV
jgi:hypothetical protein